MMPFGKVLQRLANVRQELDRVVLDTMREAHDLRMRFRRNRGRAEPLKSSYKRMSKTVQAVSVSDDALALNVIEDFANLFGLKLVMIQERDEARDGALEIDVVLPQRIVGVDEESLSYGSH